MRITFADQLANRTVNEQSGFTLTARVWDDTNDTWVAQIPTSLRYRVDDATRGVELLGWTTLTPAASSSIAVPSSANVITDGLQPNEKRVLQVQANAGLSTQYSETYHYRVTNLIGVT